MTKWPVVLVFTAFIAVLAAWEANALSDAAHRITLAQLEAVK